MNAMVVSDGFRMCGVTPSASTREPYRQLPRAGVGGDRGLRMTRHFDFGDDADESRARVLDDFAYVVLRVETAVRLAVVDVERRIALGLADERLRPPCAGGGETRVFLDLDPPALVVGEMPVEGVHFVQREQVDVLLDELLRHEVA